MSRTGVLTGLVSMALLVVGLLALLPDCASACSCGGGVVAGPKAIGSDWLGHAS